MKRYRRILAALFAVCLLFSLCGCLKYNSNVLKRGVPVTQLNAGENDSTTAPSPDYAYDPTQWGDTVVVPTTTSPAVPVSETPTAATEPGATVPNVPTTAAPPSTTQNSGGSGNAMDPSTWTKEQALIYLTNAVNRTKAYKGNVTVDRTERFDVNVDSIQPNVAALKSLANTVIGIFIKPTTEKVSFSNGRGQSGDEVIPLLLPKRQGFALPASGVKAISAKKSGNNIEIYVTLVAETGSIGRNPPYNAASLGYLDIDGFSYPGLTIDRVDITYTGSTIHAVILPNGYVQSAEYTIPIKLSASGKALGINGSLLCSGSMQETWKINW